jgi:hypothetical protein
LLPALLRPLTGRQRQRAERRPGKLPAPEQRKNI